MLSNEQSTTHLTPPTTQLYIDWFCWEIFRILQKHRTSGRRAPGTGQTVLNQILKQLTFSSLGITKPSFS